MEKIHSLELENMGKGHSGGETFETIIIQECYMATTINPVVDIYRDWQKER